MCDAEYIKFFRGERREIEGYALPKQTGETVVITSAEYEVTKDSDGTVAAKGSCDIDGNTFRALLSFDEAGDYVFIVSLVIGEEALIEKAYICVTE